MNNTRYFPSSALLGRLGALAGLLSAVVLLLNAAKRGGIVEASPLVQLAAPVAQLAAILLFAAIAARAGLAGWRLIPGLAAIIAMAALVGVEFILNFVFPYVSPETTAALRQGPLGIALTVASIAFLLTSLALVAAWWGVVPRWAVLLYAIGTLPVGLRAFVPEAALLAGLIAMAVGALGLAVGLVKTPTPREAIAHSA